MDRNKTKQYRFVLMRASTASRHLEVTFSRADDPRVVRSKARMIAAAADLLIEAGPRAVTADAVAERSGVAKSTMYRHWPSITDLLADVIRAHVPKISLPTLDRGCEAALRSVTREVADTFTSPEWARIMPALLSLQHELPEFAQLVTHDRDAKVAVVEAVLAVGMVEGILPRGIDAIQASQLLFGPLVLALLSGDTTDIIPLADTTVDHFLAAHRSGALSSHRRRAKLRS